MLMYVMFYFALSLHWNSPNFVFALFFSLVVGFFPTLSRNWLFLIRVFEFQAIKNVVLTSEAVNEIISDGLISSLAGTLSCL